MITLAKYTDKSQEAFVKSQRLAKSLGNQAIEPEHLLAALIDDITVRPVIQSSGVALISVKDRVQEQLDKFAKTTSKDNYLSPRLNQVISVSESYLSQNGDKLVTPLHLVRALITLSSIKQMFIELSVNPDLFTPSSVSSKGNEVAQKSEDSVIDKYCVNLVTKARAGQLNPTFGRASEITKLTQILLCHGKNNAILVGKAGVGKSSVVRGLAQMIADGKVQENLRKKNIFSLDIGALIAGASLRGQFEERMKGLLKEFKSSTGDAILLIDDIDTIVGAGGEGASDASSLLKTALAGGDIQVLGTASPEGYRNKIEKDKSLSRWFQQIIVEEPSFNDTVKILEGVMPSHEKHHCVKTSKEALEASVRFSKRYFADRQLPDIAIDLLDMSASRLRLLGVSKEEMSPQDVASLVAEVTGIPVSNMMESERERLLRMEEQLGAKVIGQRDAIKAVSQAVRRNRSGLADPNRPIGSFFFLGSSGVGKTELCREVANFMFGEKVTSFHRFDMAEFQEKHSVARLLGAPNGYKGSDEGGQLTQAVKTSPYSVVLFDEIEKAHADLLLILLSVLDDGRLTDGQGNLVDFKNTIIVMTSNVGGARLLESTVKHGYLTEESKEQALSDLKKVFKPEFLGRIDSIVPFESLTKDHIGKIAQIQFKKLNNLLAAKEMSIEFSDAASEVIALHNFEPQFGARPLKNTIQKMVYDPLSTALFEGNFAAGDVILVDSQANDKLTFTRVPKKN